MHSPLAALTLAVALIASAPARADVDVHINVGPPPPVVVFESQPPVVLIPQTHVYYVPAATGYDMYRYGHHWYINREGYWYRSNGYRGPFKLVAPRHVPHAIVVVPSGYRHHPVHPHGGPPGHHKHSKHRKHHAPEDDD
jgi:hypothetical protein